MLSQENKAVALIIEDEPDLIHIFARALELSGYQINTTSDGNEALAILGQMVPDIVVLDLHLPGVSGREILQTMRKDERLDNTRIILATADYRAADELRDDADLVLLKPISFKQLRDLSARLNKSTEEVPTS